MRRSSTLPSFAAPDSSAFERRRSSALRTHRRSTPAVCRIRKRLDRRCRSSERRPQVIPDGSMAARTVRRVHRDAAATRTRAERQGRLSLAGHATARPGMPVADSMVVRTNRGRLGVPPGSCLLGLAFSDPTAARRRPTGPRASLASRRRTRHRRHRHRRDRDGRGRARPSDHGEIATRGGVRGESIEASRHSLPCRAVWCEVDPGVISTTRRRCANQLRISWEVWEVWEVRSGSSRRRQDHRISCC